MQCEKCRERKATVHLKEKIGSASETEKDWEEHHLCEECFRRSPEFNPGYGAFGADERCSGDLFQFSYAWRPGHWAETVRVVSSSTEQMVLRVLSSENSNAPEDWVFLLARLPGPWRKWPVGKEVQLSLSQGAYEYLQGKRDSYDDPGLN